MAHGVAAMSEQKQATPAEELRWQFMHHSTPLTEAGHWARQHIEELEEIIEFQEGVRKLDNAEFGKLRRAKEALQAELDQEQRKAGQEMIERLALIEKVQQLEAEVRWLREALETRRDWFAMQIKSASKGNFSEWDLHALQIELDAVNAALTVTKGH